MTEKLISRASPWRSVGTLIAVVALAFSCYTAGYNGGVNKRQLILMECLK